MKSTDIIGSANLWNKSNVDHSDSSNRIDSYSDSSNRIDRDSDSSSNLSKSDNIVATDNLQGLKEEIRFKVSRAKFVPPIGKFKFSSLLKEYSRDPKSLK